MSRIRLDMTRRETMAALSAPQRIHGAIESSYDSERKRILWRIDRQRDLLIVSPEKLALGAAAAQFGYGEDSWECKDYQPFLNRIKAGTRWQFMVKANPVFSSNTNGERGEVHAHVSEQYQRKWLSDRALKNGFYLEDGEYGIVEDRWLEFKKNGIGSKVVIRQVTYSGRLTVADADALREMLCNGIGKAKAYGCGLMTLVKANG